MISFGCLEPREQTEYAVMRDTIRQRGTARIVLVPLVFLGWAGTAVATAAVITVALSTLVPLLVLAAGFEAVFALHMNVERIGRYLQVFHERHGGWEQVASAYGQRFPGSGPDPLFAQLFVLGVSANFLPAALGGEVLEVAVIAVLHLILVYRIRTAHAAAARQRQEDLDRFEQLRTSSQPAAPARTP
ncbi:hypothetical protein BH24ACI5_BH24ACI5_08450 [soil metagenome]